MRMRRGIAIILSLVGVYVAGALIIDIVSKQQDLYALTGTLRSFSCDVRLRGDSYEISISNSDGDYLFEGMGYGCTHLGDLERFVGAPIEAKFTTKGDKLRFLRVNDIVVLSEEESKVGGQIGLAVISLMLFGLSFAFWRAKSW